MKKLLLLTLTAIMMVGCEEGEILKKYEVVLNSKDTVYIEAYDFAVTRESNYIFIDGYFNTIAAINSPICVKQLKGK